MTERRKIVTKVEYTIKNKVGLHARPASLFVKKANEFESDITIEANGTEIDGKSILSVMSLGAGKGTCVIIGADGKDEEDAVAALVQTLDAFED